MQRLFSQEDLKRVREAVAQAESRTSGEIVPVIARRSVDVQALSAWLALAGVGAGTLAALWLETFHPFVFDWKVLLGGQAFGAFFGWSIGHQGWAVRTLMGQARLTGEVLNSANLAFLRYGLFNTRERTGVLIYLALTEHKVQILADKGIHEKVPANYWQQEVEKISAGIRAGRSAAALSEVIVEIGAKLAEHFPRSSSDTNELPNRLRLQ